MGKYNAINEVEYAYRLHQAMDKARQHARLVRFDKNVTSHEYAELERVLNRMRYGPLADTHGPASARTG